MGAEVRRWYDHLPTSKNQRKPKEQVEFRGSVEEWEKNGGTITRCPPCTASEYWKEKCAWQFKATKVPGNL